MREIYSIKSKQTSIHVSGSRIESVRDKDILRTGLRIIEDGFFGVAGTIGEYDMEELESRARKALSAKIEYPYALSSNREEKVDLIKDIFPNNGMIDEIEAVLEYLRANHGDFIFSNKVNLDMVNITLENENNLNLSFSDSAILFSLIFKEKASSNIMDGYIVFQDRKYNKKDFITIADSILNAYRNTVDITEGNYPVVFLSIADSPLKKFMTDLNGRDFGTGSSLFSGKLGQKVFSENLTLFNSMNPDDTCLMPFFDAEGIINNNYRYPLIENGVLRAANTDKKFSALYNLPHTGSAVSDYDGTPQPGFANIKVKECEKTAKELLAGDKGILVYVASGGDFTPDGDFAAPVQLAFLFDGEKLMGRLPELQVTSNLFHMYGNGFRGVSKDEIGPLGGSKAMVIDMEVSKI